MTILDQINTVLAGCEGVTPGPWDEGDGWVFALPIDAENHPGHALRNILEDVPASEMRANAAHIARLDPEFVTEVFTLAKQALEQDWRPIEAAPKDGTKVDLWIHDASMARAYRVTDAWWDTDDGWMAGRHYWVEAFFAPDTGIPVIRAIYWRPSPTPPGGVE